MKRLDSALVDLKLAPTRSKAQQLIDAGEVEVLLDGWEVIYQASLKISEPSLDKIRLKSDAKTLKYVSRGGLKLEAALKHAGIQPVGWVCFDVGLSTGGFSDCLLQHGAARVIGIDVGHGQLNSALADNPRLTQHEGINARDLAKHKQIVPSDLKLCVADVSFISLEHIVPALSEVLPQGCHLLALVKPQFEVGAENLDKNGIVRDQTLFGQVHAKILSLLEKFGFSVQDYFPCEVKGTDGNQEFFVSAIRS